MKMRQQGFALIESMAAVVVFAILLIALLNYTQYITLNFNQIYQESTAIRALQSSLERKASSMEITSVDSEISYPDWQWKEIQSSQTQHCTESAISLLSGKRPPLSLSRWFCAIGESHVSGLSF
ncbi:MAG: prepilin-type N-terminal cleavage/methylation domain-containing protein [Providencia heimbachae]|nr:prepilin-type N-terminal cleavage/methylation domain-containing protein [Providencia heimbachae]